VVDAEKATGRVHQEVMPLRPVLHRAEGRGLAMGEILVSHCISRTVEAYRAATPRPR
jgi:hypothetical protein